MRVSPVETQGVTANQSIVVLFVLLVIRHRAIGQCVWGLCHGALSASTSRVRIWGIAALLRSSSGVPGASTSAIIRRHDVSVKCFEVRSGTLMMVPARRFRVVSTDISHCDAVVIAHELVHGHLAVDRFPVWIIRALGRQMSGSRSGSVANVLLQDRERMRESIAGSGWRVPIALSNVCMAYFIDGARLTRAQVMTIMYLSLASQRLV